MLKYLIINFQAALRWHMREAHNKADRRRQRLLYKCEICKITMNELEPLAVHMKKVHPTRQSLFCPLKHCAVIVTDWDFHLRLQHKDHLRQYFRYKCKACNEELEATDKAAEKHVRDKHASATVVIDLSD